MSDYLLVKEAIPLVEVDQETLTGMAYKIQQNSTWYDIKKIADEWFLEDTVLISFEFDSQYDDQGGYDKTISIIYPHDKDMQSTGFKPEKDPEDEAEIGLSDADRDNLSDEWNDVRYSLDADTLDNLGIIDLTKPPYNLPKLFMESPL